MTIAIAPSGAPGATTRVEVFVRSLAPTTGREQQDRIVERVRDLADRGVLEQFDCHVCGDSVCPSTGAAETEPGQFLLSRYRAFEQWGDVRDRELCGFERRRVAAPMNAGTGGGASADSGGADGAGRDDDAESGIRFPRVAMAEYAGDRLSFVTPSAEDGETTTVAERLATLEG